MRVQHRGPRRIDRPVGLSAEARAAAGDGHDAVERLVEEPGHAHPRAARDDHRRRRAGHGRVHGLDDPRELGFPPDETSADHAPRHRRHCRGAPRRPERVPPRARRPAAATADRYAAPVSRTAGPASGERPQRAPRRGVAVLHQVGVDDRVPVRARPCPAAGARRQQAAAADGPPDRVLHPDRRARPRSVRGRRRDPARRRDRPRPAARRRDRARPAVGNGLRARRSTRCAPSMTAPGRGSRTSAPNDPGGLRTFDPAGIELRLGDARTVLPTLPPDSVDFVATDPPYNVQLPMTMAGGKLAMTHANRRTDYAMRSRSPRGPREPPRLPRVPRRDERDPGRAPPGAPARALRGADRPRRLPGRAIPVHRRGPRRARPRPRASCPRAT